MADSLESKTLTLTVDETGEIWEMIEKHIQLEKKTVELAEEAWVMTKGKKILFQEYLIYYLLEDAEKHSDILTALRISRKACIL